METEFTSFGHRAWRLVMDVTYSDDETFAPEGHLTVAQQFTAGAENGSPPIKSRRDGRKEPSGLRPSLQDGDGLSAPSPSDKSLGYFQPTLRVEDYADISQ